MIVDIVICWFCFQAEDGIRDLVRARGLGDVYKRQGVGKTALEMSLLSFATKYQGLRCVFFDKDRGAEIGIRAMGGKYFPLKRGVPTGFNPFQFTPTAHNLQFCEKLVAQLVKNQGDETPILSAKEQQDISHAVRTLSLLHI